jgi:hypothetical protein
VVSLGIFSVAFHVPAVDSASKNEYQDIPAGKNLEVPMSLGALTSQNPYACNEITLPLPIPMQYEIS